MSHVYLPGATIGVMGGGQLGRMLAFAARRTGYRVHIFSPEKDGPAAQVSNRSIVADYADEEAVKRFAADVDVITFEFENIPVQTIEWCAHDHDVRPAGAILHIAQNRLREKNFLAHAGIPLAPFRAVRSASGLKSALGEIGRPAILKTAAFGYDGKGQQAINEDANLEEVWSASSGNELVLEGAVAFEKEVSVLVARGTDGAIKTFPLCENIHRDHILDITVVPARVESSVERAAAELARSIAEKLELVGLLAVEMFLKANGDLLVNELAPRPHNSGHWTIEACATSQFEQQVRAVCGLPLGATNVLRPAAMANLLGDVWQSGEPDWSAALAVGGVGLHLYGKREPRLRRKMGHLTAFGADADEAIARVTAARSALQSGST
ncbi:MAG: 5-(carboxyamino)imidazole ribonucleotide synthase [Chthoniobacterales bacterium]|nr:5-(carboxyamino)imidazole ribonucleotide synthase [Chthoniobacterales bacterium]